MPHRVKVAMQWVSCPVQKISIPGPLLSLVPACGVLLLFSVGFSVLKGAGPWDLARAVGEGAWGSPEAILATLNKLTPLLLTGLSVALAYQGGWLNIGCEGQLTFGALAGAALANACEPFAGAWLQWVAVGAGALVGALWAYPAVWLRQRKGIHEVISTLLLNYVAIHCADYLARGPLGDGSAMARTPEIPAIAVWQPFWSHGAVGLSVAPLIALGLMLVMHVWLTRTLWGFEAIVAGTSPAASQTAGIAVDAWQRRLFLASGALAGMAGAIEVVALHHRFYAAFSPGYGFDGITAAFLVNNQPGWLWLSGLLMASLRSADKWLQLSLGISPSVIVVMQAVVLLTVACSYPWATGRAGADRRSDA
jgi:simple sugar transport system permease protein